MSTRDTFGDSFSFDEFLQVIKSCLPLILELWWSFFNVFFGYFFLVNVFDRDMVDILYHFFFVIPFDSLVRRWTSMWLCIISPSVHHLNSNIMSNDVSCVKGLHYEFHRLWLLFPIRLFYDFKSIQGWPPWRITNHTFISMTASQRVKHISLVGSNTKARAFGPIKRSNTKVCATDFNSLFSSITSTLMCWALAFFSFYLIEILTGVTSVKPRLAFVGLTP